MQRFAGTVEAIAPVQVDAMAAWISAIPLSEWHQQHRTQPHQLRPAMMTDLQWHDFGVASDPVVSEVIRHLPGGVASWRALSVVMPGDTIPEHVDEQPESWCGRIHVPLHADGDATFRVGGVDHRMRVGTAYIVNTLVEHGVNNRGTTPRIHFMFDVRRA